MQTQIDKSSYFDRKMNEQDKIWIISDLHYLSHELHDQGEKFQFIKNTSAGKDLDFSKERLEALIWQIEQEKPKILLVSGDLTLNGEKLSAEELANYFERITKIGTQVYVIPGNHDISNGWARKYRGTKAENADQILPEEFAEIFSLAGYSEAFSRDSDSLSYAVRPFNDVIIVMIDTNKYMNTASSSSPATSGKVRKETYNWLNEIYSQAKKEDAVVIPVMHHNLIDHNSMVNQGFTIDDADSLQDYFLSKQANLIFSGHIHAQNIAEVKKDSETIYDIATGSFASLSNPIGEIEIKNQALSYTKKNLLMNDWAKATDQINPQLLDYEAYSTSLFYEDGVNMAKNQLIQEGWANQKEQDEIASFIGRINVWYFAGSKQRKKEFEAFKNEEGYQLLQKHQDSFLTKYVESILSEKNFNDSYLEVKREQ
ncbi:metallophosphoesterase [Enterococcus sp. LJL99]